MVKLRSPLYAQIETTYVCNLGCDHCYNEPRFEPNSSGLLQIQHLKKEPTPNERFPEIARELARNEVFSVSLTGGEVFTLRDRLFPTLEVLANEGLETYVNSNLTITTEDDAKRLRDSGVSGVLTSVISYYPETHDSITRKQGSHKRTLRGIELLRKQGIPVSVNMVASQHNRDHVYQTGIQAYELGASSFQASQAVPSCNGGQAHLDHALLRDDLITFLEDLHRIEQDTDMFVRLTIPVPYCSVWESHPHLRHLVETSSCSASRSIIQIDPSGNVKPCPMVGTNYGNILEEGLGNIWNNMSSWRDDEYVPTFCKEECDLVDSCKGGCRAEAERTNGSLDSKNPFSIKPVKLEEQPIPITLPRKLTTVQPLRARQEQPQIYTLYGSNRHMFVTEKQAQLISAISSRGGITLDEVSSDENLLRVVKSAYHAGILRKAA